MTEYLIKRLLLVPITLLGIFTITFLLLHIVPGDPVSVIVGQHADAETIAAIRSELNLDKPIHIQYINYLVNVLQGDWGRSFINRQQVLPAILQRVPNTFCLAFAAIIIQVIIGIPIGVISAIKQYSLLDRTVMIVAIAGISAPSFWIGLICLYQFVFKSDIPMEGFSLSFPDNLPYLIIPALVLGIRGVAITARLTRSSMLEVIRQDYIMTARAKGLSEKVVILKHALRNVLIPVVTYIGMDFAYLMGGAVITETVFTWPGIGLLSVQALRDKDIPMVLGTVLFIATCIVIANLLTDISYAALDPRVKLGKRT